jgi:hypothetical protein
MTMKRAGNGKGACNGWLGSIYIPTHRKLRDGWAPESLWLGKEVEGNTWKGGRAEGKRSG